VAFFVSRVSLFPTESAVAGNIWVKYWLTWLAGSAWSSLLGTGSCRVAAAKGCEVAPSLSSRLHSPCFTGKFAPNRRRPSNAKQLPSQITNWLTVCLKSVEQYKNLASLANFPNCQFPGLPAKNRWCSVLAAEYRTALTGTPR